MIRCLVDCFQVTSDIEFLKKAESLAEFMINNLWDNKGGFYDKPKSNSDFGALKLLDKPLEGNSIAADAFLRLHYLTGKQKFFELAKKTLEFFALDYRKYGLMGGVYGIAIDFLLHPMLIHIVGPKKDEITQEFLSKSLNEYYPLKVVEILDSENDFDLRKDFGYPLLDEPRAYICFGGTCNSVKKPGLVPEVIRGKMNEYQNSE
jgi:uncharacterized protein YyaL (SSP411 family)